MVWKVRAIRQKLYRKVCRKLYRKCLRIFQRAYSDGYTDGFNAAKEKYGQHSRGTAHITRASSEDIERNGIDLHGWCDCGKPIEGRWVGMANFCPWSGKAMEWN